MTNKIIPHTFYICLLLCIITSCNYFEESKDDKLCNKDSILSPYLLSVHEAKEILETDSNIILIEVSKKVKYNKEHIPNAINVWRPDFRSQSTIDIMGLRCTKQELERLLSEFGVDSSTSLLVYDTKGSVDAFRFTWILDFHGFRNYKVINGGLQSWKQAEFPTTSDTSIAKAPTKYEIQGKCDSTLLATIDDVKSAINDPETIIIDTREPYEYLGQPFVSNNKIFRYKTGAFTYGSIPTAIHLNWSDLSDLEGDHRIKCLKDLRYNLKKIGATKDKKIIVYCQSGSRSSHTAFVLRHILSYPNVKNYDGSWIEWSSEFHNNSSVSVEQKTDIASIDKILHTLELTLKENNE